LGPDFSVIGIERSCFRLFENSISRPPLVVVLVLTERSLVVKISYVNSTVMGSTEALFSMGSIPFVSRTVVALILKTFKKWLWLFGDGRSCRRRNLSNASVHVTCQILDLRVISKLSNTIKEM
jgi:hypothetical protein